MIFRRRAKPRTLVFTSLLAGGCLVAFGIYGWGLEISEFTKVLLAMAFAFFLIIIPAALLLAICKLIALVFRKIGEK